MTPQTPSATQYGGSDWNAQLAINLMKRIKWTLVVLMNFYILLVSLHPRGGMVYAMEHLFVISITTPVMYITVYSLSTMFMKTSYKQMIVFTPIVTIATTVACTASSINGGMSYFLVFVHLFGLVVDMYGYTEVFRPFLNDMGLDVDSLLKPMPNSDMKSEGYHRRKTMAVHYSRRGSTVTDDNDRNGQQA
ncbi:hypothetical protein SARC_08013 [Sphaeroforma arctica JP610]|uniref:Uncharacterized protein n=1 Tax=Sphaeroforma arctica JP610 TaxID=667725 RepID=A0A0L0FSC0_9EUKA|nr:hypothetical protein SARC_08013 [Sphaeroforma arctica JP610]KNC79594.1 hypothetical protein SARC_08013 [Sphaeroforma arctica JP610]|eukprot:XP_014153496.1 hypothetical protein SARC_08013 [Sphaeroforma arctica JP610]